MRTDARVAPSGSMAASASHLWFCWKFVPETMGKHLEDIQAYFQDRVSQRG